MIEKPSKKHRGKPTSASANPVIKALLQESHFTLDEFAKFAGVSPATVDNYLYMRVSPVCKSKDSFWRPAAKKLAAAFGLNPEDIYPVETWEDEMFCALSQQSLKWRIDRWRKTNTNYLVNKHERSHLLFKVLMELPRHWRSALMHWALRIPMTSKESYHFKKGLNKLKIRMRKAMSK